MTPEALACARTIFDYLQLRHTPAPADMAIVFGTNDKRVANYAADLYRQGYSSTMVVSGGIAHQNDLLATNWSEPEAEVFAQIMIREGVPADRILLETKAINTAQNLALSRALIESRGLQPRNLLLVSKPFMQRRVFATHAIEWPEAPATLASWASTFDEYCNDDLPPERITNIMMGDLQRVWVYARRGWSAPQKLPDSVRDAFERLKSLGYDKHLIPED